MITSLMTRTMALLLLITSLFVPLAVNADDAVYMRTYIPRAPGEGDEPDCDNAVKEQDDKSGEAAECRDPHNESSTRTSTFERAASDNARILKRMHIDLNVPGIRSAMRSANSSFALPGAPPEEVVAGEPPAIQPAQQEPGYAPSEDKKTPKSIISKTETTTNEPDVISQLISHVVFFPMSQYNITHEVGMKLDALLADLRQYIDDTDVLIGIRGHASPTPFRKGTRITRKILETLRGYGGSTAKYQEGMQMNNELLSELRAYTVRNYLTKGLNRPEMDKRIVTVGVGASVPVCINKRLNDPCRPGEMVDDDRSRRVEIFLFKRDRAISATTRP